MTQWSTVEEVTQWFFIGDEDDDYEDDDEDDDYVEEVTQWFFIGDEGADPPEPTVDFGDKLTAPSLSDSRLTVSKAALAIILLLTQLLYPCGLRVPGECPSPACRMWFTPACRPPLASGTLRTTQFENKNKCPGGAIEVDTASTVGYPDMKLYKKTPVAAASSGSCEGCMPIQVAHS